MAEKNQIRQAENSVKIEGILRELKLEMKDDVISGEVIIATDQQSEHAVRTYAKRLTNEGKPNSAYKGLQTIIEDCKDSTIAALLKEGRSLDEAQNMAAKIRIGGRTGGQLGRNEFYAGTEFVSRPSISANFFHRIVDKSFAPKAEFDVECYFDKIRKEIKGEVETGRIIVEAVIPCYNGVVIPMEFVAEGDAADYIEQNYETKKTGRIWGEVINVVERVVTKKSGFGKDKEDITVNYTREFRIVGGKDSQYDVDSDRAYPPEVIQAAMRVRETETLPALLQKSKDRDKEAGGFKKGGSRAPGFTY